MCRRYVGRWRLGGGGVPLFTAVCEHAPKSGECSHHLARQKRENRCDWGGAYEREC